MTAHKTYWFYYSSVPGEHSIIRIRGKRKPSIKSMPTRGTWVVQEIYEDKWQMPCFPEITWGTLSKLYFNGKDPV